MRILSDSIVRESPAGGQIFSGTALTAYRDGDDEVLLCAFRAGSQKVGADGRIELSESRDHGVTWMPLANPLDAEHSAELAPPGGDLQLAGPHIGASSDGTVILVAARMRVVGEGDPGYDPQTAGIVDAECMMLRLRDGVWSEPIVIDGRRTPDEWAIPCGPPVHLGDGRWFAPAERHAKPYIAEWLRGYDAFHLESHDDGRTWSVAGPMLNDPDREVVYYDQQVARLADGRLLGLAWVHDVIDDVTLPARAGWSTDDGETWSAPHETAIHGGPAAPVLLANGTLIAAYPHRTSPAGVRLVLSHDDGLTWDAESDFVVWDETTRTITGRPATAPVDSHAPEPLWDTMWSWSFGLPTAVALGDDTVGVVFYCLDGSGASGVRFVRLKV